MRTLILIFVTIALLVGGLFVYTWMQPAPPARSTRALTGSTTQPRPTGGDSIRGVGSGENAWVKRYQSGELHSQFRGDRYDPQKDGTVHVVHPQAEFFAHGGKQRVRIEGATGNVITQLPPEPDDGKFQARSGEMSPPSRGKLQDVVVSVFEPAEAAEPILVARMKNAAFDADKFLIATESYTDANGNRIEGDQVPVVVRGRDYDFDGRGLTIGWNERDRKLQLLEIAHGQSLTVKNAEMLSGQLDSSTTKPAPQAGRLNGSLVDEMLATTDPGAVALILAAAKPPPVPSPTSRKRLVRPTSLPMAPSSRPHVARDLSPVVYRTTFEEDVRIFNGDEEIATLDRMSFDILQTPAGDDTTTRPSVSSREEAPPKHREETARPKEKKKEPTTMKGPITVRWKGKLRVIPLEGSPDPRLVPDKPVVQMFGSPAVLRYGGTEARSGTITYNAADSSAELSASQAVPLVALKDSSGAQITTPNITYRRDPAGRSVATLTGDSRAEFPVEDGGGAAQNVIAKWKREGRMIMTEGDDGKSVMEQADLSGDVIVEHPQIGMKADALSLAFDPPEATKEAKSAATANPSREVAVSLREIVATGNVHCQIIDDKQPQSIDGQRLRVVTARSSDGKTYAKRMEADGDVKTVQDGNELRAGHLAVDLEPATQPSVASTESAGPLGGGEMRVVAMEATENVRLSTPDGAAASAQSLKLDGPAGKQFYRLSGNPASIANGEMTLRGAEVHFAPDEQVARIPAGGTFDGVSPENPNQPIHIRWTGLAEVKGDGIDIHDQVVMTSTGVDGTIHGAQAKHLHAVLADKPPPANAATKPARQNDSQMSFLNNKQITTATLSGDVKVKSELKDAKTGALLRGVNLFADALNFDQSTGGFGVPGPGQMIYRDYRETEKAKGESESIGTRGDTAFGWKKSLTYDPVASKIVMSGDVQAVHEGQPGAPAQFRITAQSLTADIAPTKKAPAATRTADPAGNIQIKRVTAAGDVRVTSKALNFTGPNLVYDPIQEILIATGNDAYPIIVSDNKSGSSQSAAELWWNTKTDQFRVTQIQGKVRQ